VIMKRVALATSAVVGGVSLGVWALPKLQKDEVSVLYSIALHTLCSHFCGFSYSDL